MCWCEKVKGRSTFRCIKVFLWADGDDVITRETAIAGSWVEKRNTWFHLLLIAHVKMFIHRFHTHIRSYARLMKPIILHSKTSDGFSSSLHLQFSGFRCFNLHMRLFFAPFPCHGSTGAMLICVTFTFISGLGLN